MNKGEKEIIVIYTAVSYLEIEDEVILKNLGNKYVDKALLESSNLKFKITFYTSFSNIDLAIEETKSIVNKIENLTNYKHDKRMLEQINLFDAYYNDPPGMQFRSITKINSEVNPIVITHIQNISEFKLNLETKLSNYYNPYIDIYSNLIKLENSEGKFIIFYSLFGDLIGNQEKVDEYIKEQEPKVKMEKSTLPNSDFCETIYSYIRNQIGHFSKKSDIDLINIQVHLYLPNLQQLVKKAIEKNRM